VPSKAAPTKHAKTLDDLMLARLIDHVGRSEHSYRDKAMVMLSFKGGLRAQEIAGLQWTDVTDAEGVVRTDFFTIPGDIAKKGRERNVPMNPMLRDALLLLQMHRKPLPHDRVIYGILKPEMTAIGVTVWFHRLYEKMGFDGCSSHSGRRTFITRLARRAALHDCSIKDVQNLAGHAYLSTTERYIEPSPNVGRLVAAI
jgi:integrase